LLQLFQKEDAPLRLAIGFAFGSCTNFFPTFGFGLPLTLALTFITRTSIIGGIVGENLFKIVYPVTLYSSLLVGGLLCPLPHQPLTLNAIMRICVSWHNVMPYAKAFLLGALVNTVLLGFALTLIVYVLVSRYREQIISFLLTREEENV
jgi:uncharacterized protein (DUF2062 family)